MIPGLETISVNSLVFAVLALVLIALAWSRYSRWFPAGLGMASAFLVVSLMSPLDLLALAVFLVPPYLVIKVMWGNKRFSAPLVASMMVVWQVVLFVYLRRDEWVGDYGWLDHPIAIVGLSYMLFRVIHLIVEAPYFGHLRLSPLRYATYVLAFWTLFSGPIQRYEAFCKGLENAGRPTGEEALGAAHRAVNGLIKAFLIAPIFLKASDFQALGEDGSGWLDFAVLFYSYPIYLYLNFSGYTDLMIAIARLCGVTTLPENFNRPYLARNVQDFWTRWHISFSIWVRHYVFTPLSRALLTATPPATHNAMLSVSVIASFLVVGAWHGPTLNFVIIGLMHGCAVLTAAAYGKYLRKIMGKKKATSFTEHPVVHSVAMVLTFHFVSASILLIPNSTDDLLAAMKIMLGSF